MTLLNLINCICMHLHVQHNTAMNVTLQSICRPKLAEHYSLRRKQSFLYSGQKWPSLATTGPEGIPPRLLQECALEIAPSIYELFNCSLRTGNLPSEWKPANITPVDRKDLKEPAEHYRPISLLPILGKVLEHCMCIRLYDHVEHLTTKAQHRFLRPRSCITQLLSVLNTIGQSLDENIQNDLTYLDSAKAFDSVVHQILLH